jgi:hypothetical protein
VPEDVTDKLAKFTPTGLDRDAVLFAAGKAAGRRTVWKWLAATLAVSNAVTLGLLLWPKPAATTVVPTEPPDIRPLPAPSVTPLTAEDDLPPLAVDVHGLVPDQSPLTASTQTHTLIRDLP